MNPKIFIANLRYDIQELDFRQLCERFGLVLYVALPKDPKTGEGRGFGFVKFQEEADAVKALAELNQMYFQGRPLTAAPTPVRRPKPPKYTPPPTHPWRVYRKRFPPSLPERP